MDVEHRDESLVAVAEVRLELVAPSDDDFDLYHITAQGREYLDGERDQELHPHPFCYGLATAPMLG